MNEKNPLREVAQHLASRGRYGDTMMVHMNPIEVDMLSSLSPTGQLTTNPDTGQKEAFLPLLFSMIAPSLIGAGTAAGMSSLAASAIGSGLGTLAEGGSLKEGITAGLMGGVTGGLMNKFASGSELFKDIGKTAGEALPEAAQQLAQMPAGQLGPGVPLDSLPASAISGNMGSLGVPSSLMGITPDVIPPVTDPNLFQRMGSGVTNALSPENIGNTAGSLGAGMVGEMYVPFDNPEEIDEESPYQYEGPYVPTEQRRMIPMGDPLASAFEGEQMMLEGDVLPEGYNMRPDGYNYGGLIKRLNRGGMADTQGQIEAMANEQRIKSEERKRYIDYQPEGALQDILRYVPDQVQTARFLQDRLMGDRPAPQSMPSPYPVDTVDDRGPDFRFTEEELRMPRRKLMEPVR
tara:strand:- start:2202 stop:3416 length:1215 start_codon:yes stop_codon:yes gene_type:complete